MPNVDRELYSFLNKLRAVELDFLRLFSQGLVGCWKIFRKKGFLPYLHVDKINEKVLETLVDVLLFEEERRYFLDEE